MPRQQVIERFWRKVYRLDADRCWFWIGVTNQLGYGWFDLDGKKIKAHRFMYELAKGKIPENLDILHLCDTPSCVNPEHLRAGTRSENMQDSLKKGICSGSKRIEGNEGNDPRLQGARKLTCRKGHDYTAHGFINSCGSRECRVCSRELKLKWQRLNRRTRGIR